MDRNTRFQSQLASNNETAIRSEKTASFDTAIERKNQLASDSNTAPENADSVQNLREALDRKNRLVSDRDICDQLGVSHATLWRWRKIGRFPKPLTLSPQMNRTPQSVVDRFVAQLREAANARTS